MPSGKKLAWTSQWPASNCVGSPLLGPNTTRGKMAPQPMSLLSWMSWQSGSPIWMLGTNLSGHPGWLYCGPLQKQSCMATATVRPGPHDAGSMILGHRGGGAYLFVVRGLVFEGSVLAYNPTMNEMEWIPVCGLTNDLTWAKERSTMALANYVLHAPAEASQIARLGAQQIVSCPDSSLSEEDEVQHPELQTTDTEPEWEEENEDGARQTDPEEEVEPDSQQHPQDWEAVVEESEGLAFDDPLLDSTDSMATVMGADDSQGPALSLCDEAINCPPHTPRSVTPHMPGSPMDQMLPLDMAITSRDAIKVNADETELDNL